MSFGVTEDGGRTADGGAGFFATLVDLGMKQNRVNIGWNPIYPTEIQSADYLNFWMPAAVLSPVRIIFSVSPYRARDLTSSRTAPRRFAAYVQLLARAFPDVNEFVIGNEPNQPRFWQPQFSTKGKPLSAAAYEKVLALSYDALKGVDPSIMVVGVGLSPRGNDNPRATNNTSTSPVRFLHDLGAAYRASKRKKPIMDELAFHPYPRQNVDPPTSGYLWPNAGIPNLGRIKQAVWDAFHGTKQPTFAETGKRAPPNALKFVLDEIGWQVAIPDDLADLYYGQENVKTIDEDTQARYYATVVRLVSCDPTVDSLNFFHLIDEPDLDRWQSGLLRMDGSKRPAYDAVKTAIETTGGRCLGKLVSWRHTNTVVGAKVRFLAGNRTTPASVTSWRALARVAEEATFRAGLFRIAGHSVSKKAIAGALAAGRIRGASLSATGRVKSNLARYIRLPARRVAPGTYVYAVRLAAAMSPIRTKLFLTRPFRVVGASRPG